MFKGFYNLTSGMLTQQRNLNVVGNNLVNISTAGFKQDRYTASTFDEVMYSRVGSLYSGGQEIGQQSYIRATSDIYTDFTQGVMEPTGLNLDFCIIGDGFFAIEDPEGNVSYTRMGNFSLDDEGYLGLPGYGYVLDPDGERIYLGTDKVISDKQGLLYYSENQGLIGRLGVYSFPDNGELEYNDRGLFTGEGAAVSQNYEIRGQCLERSNTDMIRQMTEMITCQRALQSAAQISKMYDQLMTRATTEVGRLQ
ncbi:MAG: flagellar hook-basal body protein [Oscillibacter sp.]|jgi:flagellar basal-body rod protein FlgG|nr:flagellar hook-basal body protein [Oscillibacter sp.]